MLTLGKDQKRKARSHPPLPYAVKADDFVTPGYRYAPFVKAGVGP